MYFQKKKKVRIAIIAKKEIFWHFNRLVPVTIALLVDSSTDTQYCDANRNLMIVANRKSEFKFLRQIQEVLLFEKYLKIHS